jgi:hypothetical protein
MIDNNILEKDLAYYILNDNNNFILTAKTGNLEFLFPRDGGTVLDSWEDSRHPGIEKSRRGGQTSIFKKKIKF